MHSLKVDRRSCGRVLLRHNHGQVWRQLPLTVCSLTVSERSPSSNRRCSIGTSGLSYHSPTMANVHKNSRKEVLRPRQDTAEGDGDRVTPPDTKKRRLVR